MLGIFRQIRCVPFVGIAYDEYEIQHVIAIVVSLFERTWSVSETKFHIPRKLPK